MRRLVLVPLTALVVLSCLPASRAEGPARVITPVRQCTRAHPCLHVFRVGPSTSASSHVAWDSRPRFKRPNLAISVSYTPKFAYDQEMRNAYVGDCGVHFWLNGRFNGVATRCGDGALPLHVQIANVHNRPLRVVLRYWAGRYSQQAPTAARAR